MKAEWKKKWVDALRSGEYKQGYGALRVVGADENGDIGYSYCCLGVLCDIAGYDLNTPWRTHSTLETDNVPGEVEAKTGFSNGYMCGADQANHILAHMNDGHTPFPFIADWIDANIPGEE